MRLRRYRRMALLLLVLHLQACVSWQPVTLSPREFIEEDQPSAVRVTRLDGTALVMSSPRIANDSIFSECQPGDGSCTTRIGSLSLDDVSALEVRGTDITRTAWGIIGAGLFVLWAYKASTVCIAGC
jgi:hypothetical protein